MWVTKQCLSVCRQTAFLIPAFLTASWKARFKDLGVT
jgi:hypothetical protein